MVPYITRNCIQLRDVTYYTWYSPQSKQKHLQCRQYKYHPVSFPKSFFVHLWATIWTTWKLLNLTAVRKLLPGSNYYSSAQSLITANKNFFPSAIQHMDYLKARERFLYICVPIQTNTHTHRGRELIWKYMNLETRLPDSPCLRKMWRIFTSSGHSGALQSSAEQKKWENIPPMLIYHSFIL